MRVIGFVGHVVPAELIIASGALPVLITGVPGEPTPVGDEFMEETYGWDMRSVFDRALRGTYEFLDLLIITRAYGAAYYYLKEMVRIGRGAKVPPLHMYDLMVSQREASRTYGMGLTDELLARIERLTGEAVTQPRLHAAIKTTNHKRDLLRRLLTRRRAGEIPGGEALEVIGAGNFMAPDEYSRVLSDYLKTRRPDPTLSGRPRLLVLTSEPLSHTRLHEVLELAGGVVIDEDDAWGSRCVGRDIQGEDALMSIFDSVYSDSASSQVHPRDAREGWLRERIAAGGIDGVVFYLPPSDNWFGWHYPRLKAFLDDRGIASLLVRQDALDDGGRRAIGSAASAFIAGLVAAAGRRAVGPASR